MYLNKHQAYSSTNNNNPPFFPRETKEPAYTIDP